MKTKKKDSPIVKWTQITGAAVAISLLLFQLFVSEEEVNNSLFLHGIQICLVTLAAVTALILAIGVWKGLKKRGIE